MSIELNGKRLALIAVFVILIIVGSILYNFRFGNDREEHITRRTILNDYSRFFMVSNSANTYINVLAARDAHNLMILLSDDYINRHQITRNNVLEHLDLLSGDLYRFSARTIYQYQLSRYMVRYYIKGHLIEDGYFDEVPQAEIYYLILTLDTRNFTFSITPYNGRSFMEAHHE